MNLAELYQLTPTVSRSKLPDERGRAGYESWNTPLTGQEEKDFQEWLTALAFQQGRDTGLDQMDYDMRAAYLGQSSADPRGHLSDIGKKPNHPTFSTGSKYSTPETLGGTWEPQGYRPSVQHWGNVGGFLSDYMRRYEPGTPLLYPFTRGGR